MDALEFLRERKRMCESFGTSCDGCPLHGGPCPSINSMNDGDLERMLVKVEQWSKEHPRKTRQSVFLEQWPNAELDCEGDIAIEPCTIDMTMYSKENGCFTLDADCEKCRREFWRQEVE